MNNVKGFVLKYDMLVAISISMLLIFIFPFKYVLFFLLGVTLGIINYFWMIYSTEKWLGKNQVLFLLSSLLRVLITILIIVPFSKDCLSVIFYTIGIVVDQITRMITLFTWKGSV